MLTDKIMKAWVEYVCITYEGYHSEDGVLYREKDGRAFGVLTKTYPIWILTTAGQIGDKLVLPMATWMPMRTAFIPDHKTCKGHCWHVRYIQSALTEAGLDRAIFELRGE